MEIFVKIYDILQNVGAFFTEGLTIVPAAYAMYVGIAMIVFGLFVCLFGKRCWGFTYFVSVIVFCATIVGPIVFPVVKYVLGMFGLAGILASIPFAATIVGAVVGLILAICGKHGFHMTLFAAIVLWVTYYGGAYVKALWEGFKLGELSIINAPIASVDGQYQIIAIVLGIIVAYFFTYAIEPATKLVGCVAFGAALAVTGAEYAFGGMLRGMLGANYTMIVGIVFVAFAVIGLLVQIIAAIRNKSGKTEDFED